MSHVRALLTRTMNVLMPARLRLVAAALLMIGGGSSLATAQTTATSTQAHVYLLRGAFNIFSLGLDEIDGKLTQLGIPVSVSNYISWPQLADEAAADYKSGKVHTIILVGHSSGATAVTSMAARLGQFGVPVKLAIGLDPSSREVASGHVDHYVNYYVPGGLGTVVDKGPNFVGSLQNVNMGAEANVGHFTIDKNSALQDKIIKQIRAAL